MSIFKRLLGDNPPNLRRRTSDSDTDVDTDVDTNLGDDDNHGGGFLNDLFDSNDSDSDSNDSDSGNDD